MERRWFKVRIKQHTPLLFGSRYEDAFHKDKIGDVILVREASYEGSPYYECKTGESILKIDVEKISKNPVAYK